MSHELLTEHAYPVPTRVAATAPEAPTFEDWKRDDGWIEAPWKKEGYGTKRVLGIDCEMVSLLLEGRRGELMRAGGAVLDGGWIRVDQGQCR